MSRSRAVRFMEILDQRMAEQCDVGIDSAELNRDQRKTAGTSTLLFPISCRDGGAAISRYDVRNAVTAILRDGSTDTGIVRIQVRPR